MTDPACTVATAVPCPCQAACRDSVHPKGGVFPVPRAFCSSPFNKPLAAIRFPFNRRPQSMIVPRCGGRGRGLCFKLSRPSSLPSRKPHPCLATMHPSLDFVTLTQARTVQPPTPGRRQTRAPAPTQPAQGLGPRGGCPRLPARAHTQPPLLPPPPPLHRAVHCPVQPSGSRGAPRVGVWAEVVVVCWSVDFSFVVSLSFLLCVPTLVFWL